jgi:hypothetical protein
MNTKLLLIIAIVFFMFWKQSQDSFLLFCALFAAGLYVCVFIYRMENTQTVIEEDAQETQ